MFLRATRFLGGLAVLAVGAVHLQQYAGPYHQINTIGPLFLLNGIACAVVGFGLLMPIERWSTGRMADRVISLLAVGGIAIALGSLAALFISESSTLFGFSEAGYDSAIVTAIAAEVAATLFLVPVAWAHIRDARARRRAVSGGQASTPTGLHLAPRP